MKVAAIVKIVPAARATAEKNNQAAGAAALLPPPLRSLLSPRISVLSPDMEHVSINAPALPQSSRRNPSFPLRPLLGILWHTVRRIEQVNRGKKQGTLSQKELHQIMMNWGGQMLELLGCRHEVRGIPSNEPALLVGNHISYVDIPLVMTYLPAAFVAKKQLAAWPVFGAAMRCVGTVFVDRDNKESRKKVGEALAPRIINDKQSVAVFPSGTTTMDENREWRQGAFVIAKQFNLKLQPFRVYYEPLRPVAFLLEDGFVAHLWYLLRCGGFRAVIEFHPPVSVEDIEKDAAKWWQWSRAPLVP